jgi:hypothetical protein
MVLLNLGVLRYNLDKQIAACGLAIPAVLQLDLEACSMDRVAKRGSTQIVCKNCGKPFKVYNSQLRDLNRQFCSRDCRWSFQRGENHPLWQNGHVDKDGYRRVNVGAGKVEYEHRLVVERHLGRKLTPEENVHHIDGDTLNNEPSNLMIVSRGEHMTLHNLERPRKLSPDDVRLARELREQGLSYRAISDRFSVSESTIRRHLLD